MKKIPFLKWIPGSGESTFAKGFDCVASKDALRKAFPDARESEIVAKETALVESFLLSGASPVVVDNTHFNPAHEERYRSMASKYGYGFEIKEFRTPLATCLARNAGRQWTERIPNSSIFLMAERSGWYSSGAWESIHGTKP